jgi:negative regulator of sigma E activity
VKRAEQKLFQLATAARLGLALPSSLATNAVTAAAELADAGRVIAKPLSPGQGIAPFVDEVFPDDLELVSALPVLLQRLVVDAAADLRVVVIGTVAWVWRRPRTGGVVDWRAVDPSGTQFALVENEELARDAVHMTKALGLTMSIQDWLEVTGNAPVFLEVNPQGAWAFLPGADAVAPAALSRHLQRGSNGIIQDGVWPKPLRRIGWDLRTVNRAPANDGAKAPKIVPPSWVDLAARSPEALAIAQRANDEAKAGAKAAEDKAARLAQTALAAVAVATAIGGFQVGFAAERRTWFVLLILPAAASVTFLAIAALEAVEIDRVGFYDYATAEDLARVGPKSDIASAVEHEELGRQLARWSSTQKHTSLMQARAWMSRGLVLLLVAAIVAAVSWGVRLGRNHSAAGSDSHPSTTATATSSTSVGSAATGSASTTTASLPGELAPSARSR